MRMRNEQRLVHSLFNVPNTMSLYWLIRINIQIWQTKEKLIKIFFFLQDQTNKELDLSQL